MKNEEEVKDFLKKEDYIQLAYLFGSVAQEKAGELSDVDIAVYLDKSLNKNERINLKFKLISQLEEILKTDRLDLVVMNEVPISLNFEVIKANHPLFIRDQDHKVEVEHYIMSRYLDRQYYDQRWSENQLKKTAEGLR
ncbi:MAG: type VII toxin-antitoxin system MntA family adenylyltransferase antitoxin [Methanomicrobiales archaeon]